MNLGLQAKPEASDAIDGIGKQAADSLVESVYALHASVGLSSGTETINTHLGVAPFDGSALGVSIDINATQSSGTIDVNLKVAGSTVLTATIDGTNQVSHYVEQGVGIDAITAGDVIELEVVATSFVGTPGLPDQVRITGFLSNKESGVLRRPPDYAQAHRIGNTLTGVAFDATVVFTTDGGHVGDSVSIDTSTGEFTLKGGNTYLCFWNLPNDGDSIYQVYDVTGAGYIADARIKCFRSDDPAANYPGAGPASLATILSPGSDNTYSLRCRNDPTGRETGNLGFTGTDGNQGVHVCILRIA